MKKNICMLFLVSVLLLSGCQSQSEMKDGFYTAEMSSYSHGWKEYVCIMVKDNQIVSVEFNAKDSSGYIKAWDNGYMQNMLTVKGTYPNEYTRYYAAELLAQQNDSAIDALTGATSSGNNFNQLIKAVIEQAKKGDSTVVTVSSQHSE